MTQIRVNVRAIANTAAVRHETRNGRDVIVVPSATLPDDIIMNGIKYPSDEIEKSFKSLNHTVAPFGHPMINGKFVSAKSPEGLALGYIGATNENVRRENGRVFLDKVIDVEVANRSEEGKAVIDAINKGDPVHTSTGLLCEVEQVNAEDHSRVAKNILFDHDAILLNEEGAATPEQGVGMLVNGSEIEVVNSAIDCAERELDWALDHTVRALESRERAGMVDRLKSALIEALGLAREPQANSGDDEEMAIDDKKFDELAAQVNSLSETVSGLGDAIKDAVANAVQPLTDNFNEMRANAKAKEEEELKGLRETIVKANMMSEDAAKELTLNTARELAKNAQPGKAAALNAAFGGQPDPDEFKDYDMNANFKDEK